MRRKEKEITDRSAIDAVIKRAEFCHLALTDGEQPYVVAMNFGHKDSTLYFHTAPEGRKIDLIRKNPKVCFLCYVDIETVESDEACGWTMKYKSVIGEGRARIIDDPQAKIKALDIVMEHYSDQAFTYSEKALEKMVIVEVKISRLTGKQSL